MKLPKIIGIAGPNGAGKDALGELLAGRSNYKFVSASDILREELTRRGQTHERHNMRTLSTQWADTHGPAVLSIKTIETYVAEEEAEGHNGLAIGSIRRVAEAKAIHDEGGLVIWVDSDQHTRYARLQAANRGRHEDMLPFEEWAKQEDIEMNPQSDDPRILNMAGVRAIADIKIDNNFDSFEAYQAYLIKAFEL